MSRIIGIDLGTTNTCAAYVSNKIPRIIPIEGGYNLMPSVVCLHPSGTVLVGQSAREQMVTYPERTLHGIKRLLGRQFQSKTVQEHAGRVAYKVIPGAAGDAAVEVGGKPVSTVELQTKILQQVKRYAEIQLGEEIPEAVIAVPAYYTDHQRVLVKQAGTAAGFQVRRIVNEPTAAALAYGFNRGYDQKILIYDLGGGTFDVSVLELTGNVFQVLATGGDTYLGGADFDARVIDWMVEAFRKQTKIDLTEEPGAMQRVRTAAERAKIELSLLMNTQVRLPAIVERRGRPVDLELMLDRETLNQITGELVRRTIEVVDQVLGTRGMSAAQVDELILVGGQTRMPLVNDAVNRHFGKPPRRGVNPDECVAIGAALLGDSLAKIDAVTLLDTLSIPIGVNTPDGALKVVIDRQVQLPSVATVELPTTADNQTTVQVELYQGEPGPVTEAEYLGTVTYARVPPAPAGTVKVKLDFELDAEGLLRVSASHDKGGAPEPLEITTLERPRPKEVRPPATAESPGAEAGREGAGLRGLVKNLWNTKR